MPCSWRRRFTADGLLIFLTAAGLVQTVGFLRRLAAGLTDTVDDVLGIFVLGYSVVLVVWILLDLLRTRVRLTADGLEIRRWRTRLYPHSDISDVCLDRGANDRWIKLRLLDATTIRLPAPTRGPRPSDRTLPDAVDAIRVRAGLPARSPLP